MAGASGVTAPRALGISCTPKKPHMQADPPPTDPAYEQAPAPAAPAQAAPAQAPEQEGSASAQEPAPAASPPKAGGKGGVLARCSGKHAELEPQSNFRLNFICGPEQDNLTNL